MLIVISGRTETKKSKFLIQFESLSSPSRSFRQSSTQTSLSTSLRVASRMRELFPGVENKGWRERGAWAMQRKEVARQKVIVEALRGQRRKWAGIQEKKKRKNKEKKKKKGKGENGTIGTDEKGSSRWQGNLVTETGKLGRQREAY